MLNVTALQPRYYCGEEPDRKIADFLMANMEAVAEGGLILLPEYSNAGGLSDAERELDALPRAEIMLKKASEVAKSKRAYVSINVLERRNGEIKNKVPADAWRAR